LTVLPAATFTATPIGISIKQALVYPNPCRGDGEIMIFVPLTTDSDVSVEVYTSSLRKISSRSFKQVQAGTAIHMQLTGGTAMANGIYYLEARAQGKKWYMKAVVIK
jgi:hypothetical protein